MIDIIWTIATITIPTCFVFFLLTRNERIRFALLVIQVMMAALLWLVVQYAAYTGESVAFHAASITITMTAIFILLELFLWLFDLMRLG